MLDKNKIKSYAWSSDTYFNGNDDFYNQYAEIEDITVDTDGDTNISARVSSENGNIYECDVTLKGENNDSVIFAACSCPAKCDKYGYCRHVVAALLQYTSLGTRNIMSRKKRLSSPMVNSLIYEYNKLAESEPEYISPQDKVTIQPCIDVYADGLTLSLKIGRQKMYVVKNIPQLIEDVENNTVRAYGKGLEIRHSREILTEESRSLLDFVANIINISSSSRSYYYSYADRSKYVTLRDNLIEKFFRMLPDNQIIADGRPCRICYDDPDVTMRLEKSDGGIYTLTAISAMQIIGKGRRACFYDDYHGVFYLCSPKFSTAVGGLFRAMQKSGMELDITENDMQAFYTSVIVPVKKYIHIEGDGELEKYIPPEAEIRLYLDSPSPSEVCGRLEFTYGSSTFSAFGDKSKNPVCDIRTENMAERAVLKYFTLNENDDHHPLIAAGDDSIYRLFSEGVPDLTNIMEVYASERFNNMSIRPPVRPTVGVRPKSGLLALDIDTDGYTVKELAQMLASYRRGMKYHRLRDGSFVSLTQSGIEDFAELADGLNITDKALLKENITVPRYRMLYLDSLQERSGGMRLKRSSDFRNAVRAFSDISSAEYDIPSDLDGEMREYQVYGFKWLKTISAYGFGGILADDMGLGKTIQSIALMLSAREENRQKGVHGTFLVVCPSSLTLNWESELHRFAPTLKASVIIGTAPIRARKISEYAEYDVLITSYSMLTRDIAEYEDKEFQIQFIDEAQFIKNHNTQASKAVKGIKSSIRFALTGTPVENSLAELWSIYDFIMPDYLFGYTHFKQTYETPIVKNADQHAVEALRKITSPFILRRLKKDVLTELPDKTEITLTSEMTEEQQKIYAANVLSMKKRLKEKFLAANPNEGKIEILAMLTRLRQICCDPSLVYENYTSGSAKLEQCMDLIESCVTSGHKVLLFSQFTSMLDIIERRLKREGIGYYILTGATKADERLRLVNSFNKDDTPVFMISLKAGGTGLNLTGADIVIHYDPWWNVSAENQATDRAYRIGQKNSVAVYKLISKNTIEEKIQEMQKNKKELADMAVSGDGSIMQMSPADIMSILD